LSIHWYPTITLHPDLHQWHLSRFLLSCFQERERVERERERERRERERGERKEVGVLCSAWIVCVKRRRRREGVVLNVHRKTTTIENVVLLWMVHRTQEKKITHKKGGCLHFLFFSNERLREEGILGRSTSTEGNHEDRRDGDDGERDETATDEVGGCSVLVCAFSSHGRAVPCCSWDWSLHWGIIYAVHPPKPDLVFVLSRARPRVEVAEVVRAVVVVVRVLARCLADARGAAVTVVRVVIVIVVITVFESVRRHQGNESKEKGNSHHDQRRGE